MRCAEAHPQSWFKAKILILGRDDRTIDPGVSGYVTLTNIYDLLWTIQTTRCFGFAH